ncbi:hypothetical protein BH10PSE12_BH10PSE12_22970 [soil metagenome]
MLSKFDEYPIHQTPDSLAHPATSDISFYDRTWFNGFSKSGEVYFGFGLGVYPYRDIMDGAFSVTTKGGRQHCFYASRRAPRDRTQTQIGPLTLEVVEMMKQTRITLAENDSDITCDLLFTTRTAPVEEAKHVFMVGARKVIEATRFDLFGTWEGWIETPDGRIEVKPDDYHGIKDRSWGVRPNGEPQTGGPPAPPPAMFFIWSVMFWQDSVTHAIRFDGSNGVPMLCEGLDVTTFPTLEAVDGDAPILRKTPIVNHRIDYHPGTRHVKYAELDFVGYDGEKTMVTVEPLMTFYMKGLGYFTRDWGQGVWKGELATGHDVFDPAAVDPLSPENIHVQQVARVKCGTEEGLGIFEYGCFGPYAPAGFEAFLDGAK